MTEPVLLVERPAAPAGMLVIRINRPAVRNAMNTEAWRAVRDAFRAAAEDRSVRVVVLTATGTDAFCSGADLKERNGMSDADWHAQHRLIEESLLTVHDFALPVIAAVEGFALAGGCELALMCDFIIAGAGAKFGLTEVRRGIMPGGGGLQNLPRSIGLRRAKQLVLTAQNFDARQAEAWGMVNEVVEAGGALPRALAIAADIVKAAPLSIRYAKLAMQRGSEVDFHTGYALDIAAYDVLVGTADRREGIAAFNEKREPQWKGH